MKFLLSILTILVISCEEPLDFCNVMDNDSNCYEEPNTILLNYYDFEDTLNNTDIVLHVEGNNTPAGFAYNLDNMSAEITNQFNADFADIQNRIITRTVSQRGQKYLHIHPHGSKGSKTRAFGFTNKFVTKLVSIETEKPLTTKGNSFYIDKKHF